MVSGTCRLWLGFILLGSQFMIVQIDMERESRHIGIAREGAFIAFLLGHLNSALLVSRRRLSRKRRHEILLWGRETAPQCALGAPGMLRGNRGYGSLSGSKMLSYLGKKYTRVQK